MATNPVGPGTRNVAVNMPEEMAEGLKAWAKRSGITVSLLVRHIIDHALRNEWDVEVVVRTRKKDDTQTRHTHTLKVPE